METVSTLGYDGVEGAREFLDPPQPEALSSMLDSEGLLLPGGYYAANWFDMDWRPREFNALRQRAELYAGVGAKYLVAASAGSPHRMATAGHMNEGRSDGLSDYQWECLGEAVSLAGELVQVEFGMQLVFHNHAGTYVETAHEVDRFISLTDPNTVFLAPDTGHLAYASIDSTDFIARNISRVRYVHTKDIDLDLLSNGIETGTGYYELVQNGVFTPVGAGALDFEAILGVLSEADYAGWIIVEQDFTLTDPDVAAGMSIDHLKSLIGS